MYFRDPRIVEAFTEGDCLPFAVYLADKYRHLTLHDLNRGAHCFVMDEALGVAYDVRGIIRWTETYEYFFLDSAEERQSSPISQNDLARMSLKRSFPEVTFEEGENHLLRNLSFSERLKFVGEG